MQLIVGKLQHTDLESYIRFFDLTSEVYRQHGDLDQYTTLQSNLIEMYQLKNDHEQAYTLARRLIQTGNMTPTNLMRMHIILGNYYRFTRNYDSGYYYLKSSLDLALREKDHSVIPLQYLTLAALESQLGNKYRAIDYTVAGIDSCTPELSYLKPGAYRQLADLMIQLKNYDRAEEYARKALALSQENESHRYAAYALVSLGQIAIAREAYDSAYAFIHQAHQYYANQRNQIQLVTATLLTRIQLLRNHASEAKGWLAEATQFLELNDNAKDIHQYYLVTTEYHLTRGEFNEAAKTLDLAEKLESDKIPIGQQISGVALRQKLAEHNGDYRAANNALKAIVALEDSLQAAHQSQLVLNLEAKFLKSEQDKEIAQLSMDQIRSLAELSRRNSWLIAGGITSVLLVIIALVLFRLYASSKKHKEALASKNTVIEAALGEKNILLQEIHHRVKNNLQVISSLLKLQTRHTSDETVLDAISASRTRVQSMALLHQNLYRDHDLKGVQMKEYLENLAENLFDTYNINEDRIKFAHQIDDISLDIDTVIPIGLITNELISNALKHAFKKDTDGELHLRLFQLEGLLVLELIDNGIGLPDKRLIENGQSLGVRLIRSFAEKLNADIEVTSQQGTAIRINIRDFHLSHRGVAV
jgi:two-component sensor histidine kinase